MTPDEYILASAPSPEEFLQMEHADEGAPERFFNYYPITPCGRSIKRVAVFTGIESRTDTHFIVHCVSELLDPDELDEDEPMVYAEGQLIIELDRSGDTHIAYVELWPVDYDDCQQLFDRRPSHILIGL